MKNLFKAIQNLLASIEVPNQGRKALGYVDEDWGQLNMEKPPVKWPCALISMADANWEDEGRQTQRGTQSIDVVIAHLPMTPSSAGASDTLKDASLYTMELAELINAYTHGVAPPSDVRNWGALSRKKVTKINRNDGIRAYRIRFEVQVYDDGASPVYDYITLTPDLPQVGIHN
jgi:hypothetical protein